MNQTTRFTKFLGECRRQMNGAVASSMRYYGSEYGLNYGVSLPTIRSLASAEGKDHAYACYLFQQQVREIRLGSLHIAEPEMITTIPDLKQWESGIINSEVAEEAAFALFQYVNIVSEWLKSENELLLYTAILSISRSKSIEAASIKDVIIKCIQLNTTITNTAIITLLENYYKIPNNRHIIDDMLRNLPKTTLSRNIIEELEWRCAEFK